MTKLEKPITREVDIDGTQYYVSMLPEGAAGVPAIKFKKKGSRGSNGEWQMKMDVILEYLMNWKKQGVASDKQHRVFEVKEPELGIGDMEIHPSDLEMWARCADSKFKDAWDKYKTMTVQSGNTVQILWRQEGAIELVHTRTK
tara:strand:+ start:82 stop:510 length:429 start_codon:yes stop_codon:yes gene_type:complete